MQKQKKKHECPKCGSSLKRTIGAQSRMKFWECVRGGVGCYRVQVANKDLDINWGHLDQA